MLMYFAEVKKNMDNDIEFNRTITGFFKVYKAFYFLFFHLKYWEDFYQATTYCISTNHIV